MHQRQLAGAFVVLGLCFYIGGHQQHHVRRTQTYDTAIANQPLAKRDRLVEDFELLDEAMFITALSAQPAAARWQHQDGEDPTMWVRRTP